MKPTAAFVLLTLSIIQILEVSTTSSRVPSVPGPIITTQYGPIQGVEEFYDGFRSVYTYKGVRYAAPPVGNLRFRQAMPPTPWTQIFQATQHGPRCPQLDMNTLVYEGNEDCLFVNIATPTGSRTNYPVVVNFHGGGLHAGAGEIDFMRADYINEEDVIYVAPNYRLSILGFLNTNDKSSPGNYGLKDMIMVLQWVQNNIRAFGGDPNNVSIMGVSGGGVAVHALVVSRAAQGLFHRAISHSGSLFNPYAFTRNPQASIAFLINHLQLQVSTMEDLVYQLRSLPAETLVRAMTSDLLRMPRLFVDNLFSPSIDAVDSLETRIFTSSIENLISTGSINTVPYMIGFNSMESLYSIVDVNMNPSLLDQFNQNPHLLVPIEWNLSPNSPESQEVITAFRNLYFGGSSQITVNNLWGWTQYVSDREFIFGSVKAARLHMSHQYIRHYQFSYSGGLSAAQHLWGLSQFQEAMHGDDAFYFFRVDPFLIPIDPNDEAFVMQRTFIRLWTNYFKYGNPTAILDDLVRVTWPRFGSNGESMDISLPLRVENHPLRNRMDIWYNFDRRFSSN